MKSKWAAVFLAAWLCLCLSGCSFSALDAKNLMEPPKANADQQTIHRLLQGKQQDIAFVYPKNGSYRSAIIMLDFTGDGVKDAIGFYSLEDSGGVEVQFLTKLQGEWATAATFRNTATQVDRVCLADLTGEGPQDVLIGWGSTATTTGHTAAVNAYHYDDNGSITEHPLGVYGEMVVTDLDCDQVNEVFTVDKFLPAEAEGDEPTPARACVYAWNNGTMQEIYAADADNSISTYSAINFGRLSPTLWGVLLDGAKADGSLTTQVFYLKDQRLWNSPANVNTEEYVNPFSRPSSAPFLCRDINGDEILDIPVVSQLPGLPEETVLDSTCYLVDWSMFLSEDTHRPRTTALMNLVENYWFRVPSQLIGAISTQNDSENRTVTYYRAFQSNGNGSWMQGMPLFSIRAFPRAVWDLQAESSGYELLATQSDTVYAIRVKTRDKTFLEYIRQIRESFKLLSE